MAGALTFLGIALALASDRQGSVLRDLRPMLQVGVLAFGAVSIITHAILLYRVHKGTGLTSGESSKLAVALSSALAMQNGEGPSAATGTRMVILNPGQRDAQQQDEADEVRSPRWAALAADLGVRQNGEHHESPSTSRGGSSNHSSQTSLHAPFR